MEDFGAGKAARLTDLVGYQQGSVVSREIVARQTGTVTAFAFDGGQGLSPHSAPFDALVFVAEGSVEVAIEDSKHLLRAGDVIILPAKREHALRAVEPFKMLLVMIRS